MNVNGKRGPSCTVGDKKRFPFRFRCTAVPRFLPFRSVFVPLPFFKRAAFARCKHARAIKRLIPFFRLVIVPGVKTTHRSESAISSSTK